MKKNDSSLTAVFTKTNFLARLYFTLAGIFFVLCLLLSTVILGDPFEFFEYFFDGFHILFFLILLSLGMALFLMFGPKPTLTITKEFVIATSYFGKKLFLPISQISVIGTGFFKRITIATSKGTVNFYQVENRDKIIDFLSEHITRLQNKNSTPSE